MNIEDRNSIEILCEGMGDFMDEQEFTMHLLRESAKALRGTPLSELIWDYLVNGF